MSTFELIHKELQDFGFEVEDKLYTYVKTVQHQMIINGVPHVQEHKQLFRMEYIGDGCELDNEHNELEGTEFCGFDIKDEENYSVTTIFIKCLKDLLFYVAL